MKDRRSSDHAEHDAQPKVQRSPGKGPDLGDDAASGGADTAPVSAGGEPVMGGAWEADDAWEAMTGDKEAPPTPPPDAGRDKPVQRKAHFSKAPKDQRLHAEPHTVKMKAEIHGASPATVVALTNPGDSPVTIGGFVQQVKPAGGVDRPVGDFKLDGISKGTSVVAGGGSPPLVVIFQPQVHFPDDPSHTTKRKVKVNVLDDEQRVVATVRLEGTAKASSDATRERYAHDAVKEASHKHTKLSPPRTYAEMLRYLEVAAEHLRADAYDDALPALRAVDHELTAHASPSKLDAAMHKLGYPTGKAALDMGLAESAVANLIAIANDHVSIHIDTQLDNFRGADQLLQLLLGETKIAPRYRDVVGEEIADGIVDAKDEVVDFVKDLGNIKYDAGLFVGLNAGSAQAVADLGKGLVDGIEIALKMVSPTAIFTMIETVEKIADFLGDLPKTIQVVGEYFAAQWHNPDDYDRGKFRGRVIGYIATQIAILIFSDGAAAAIKSSGMYASLIELLRGSEALVELLDLARTARGAEAVEDVAAARRTVEAAEDANAAKQAGADAEAAGAAKTAATRTPEELAALEEALPADLRGKVEIRENPEIEGSGVRVKYKDGPVRLEVGPDAKPRHIRYHGTTARFLRRYEGILGEIRKLLSKLMSKLRLTPGWGTEGFEASYEVQKLEAMRTELETLQIQLEMTTDELASSRAGGAGDTSRVDVAVQEVDDAATIEEELASVEEQLARHKSAVESYEPGTGHVAAEGESAGPSRIRRPEVRVNRRDLTITSRSTPQEWTFTIDAPLPNGRETIVAYGTAPLDAMGNPVGGPQFVIEKGVVVDGVEMKVQVYAEGGEAPMSITDLTLDEGTAAFEQTFGHAPETLPGSLASENKLNFQREFAKNAARGMSRDEAAQAAIREVSFGRSRVARGYDEFDLKIGVESDDIEIDFGPPLGRQKVPPEIEVVARRGSR